jgi:hypothetical protein
MSTQNDKIDFSQPDSEKNQLSFFAEQQRSKLIPRNDYNNANEYSAVNKDAVSDGDNKGRGTGGFLDGNNLKAGTSIDVQERVDNTKTNKYSRNNQYYTIPQ